MERTGAVQFFYDHAGYSYKTDGSETRDEGHKRCAVELARAEAFVKNETEWSFTWEDDWAGDHSYRKDSPRTCECCVLRDEQGKVLASLGCIDDADRNHGRVVEAELAEEAIEAWRAYGARVNA